MTSTLCLPRALICLLLFAFASAPPARAAVAGRVLLAAGDAVAIRAGRVVRLAVGTAVEDRDVLRTGAESNLQVRLTDSSVLALKPGSTLAIEQYAFRDGPDGTESAVFRLLKGGFRTVTGLIGRVNRSNYRVNTGVATIGVRGTAYALALCDGGCTGAGGRPAADGLYGTVTDGEITAANRTGESRFAVGESFHAARNDAPIQRLLMPPPFLADRLEGQRRGSTRPAAASDAGQGEGSASGENAAAGTRSGASASTDAGNIRVDAAREALAAAIADGSVRVALVTAISNLLDDDGRTRVLPRADGFVVAMPLTVGSLSATLFGDRTQGTFDAANRLTDFAFTTSGGGTFLFGGALADGRFADIGRATIGKTIVTWGRWDGGAARFPAAGFDGSLPLLFATANGVASDVTKASLGSLGTVSYVSVGGPAPVAIGLPTGATLTGTGFGTTSLAIDFTNRAVALDMTLSVAYRQSSLDKTMDLRLAGNLSETVAANGSKGGLGDFRGTPGVTCSGTGCVGSTFTSDVRVATGGADGHALAVAAGGVASQQTAFTASFLQVYAAPSAQSAVARTVSSVAGASPGP